MDVLTKVTLIIAEQCFVNLQDVKPESKLAEDLGADSLDLIEIVIELEAEFDLAEFDDADMFRMKTVQDFVNLVQEKKAA